MSMKLGKIKYVTSFIHKRTAWGSFISVHSLHLLDSPPHSWLWAHICTGSPSCCSLWICFLLWPKVGFILERPRLQGSKAIALRTRQNEPLYQLQKNFLKVVQDNFLRTRFTQVGEFCSSWASHPCGHKSTLGTVAQEMYFQPSLETAFFSNLGKLIFIWKERGWVEEREGGRGSL